MKCHGVTDSNPLAYLISSAKLSPTDQRWLTFLAPFDFTITYRRGKENGDADGLSRIPRECSGSERSDGKLDYLAQFLNHILLISQSPTVDLSEQAFQALCQSCRVQDPELDDDILLPAVEVLGARPEAVVADFGGPVLQGTSSVTNATINWLKLQHRDPVIAEVLPFVDKV